MSRFEPHWEALPAAQREIWPQLAPSVQLGLVQYGGTAIALRLGHRTSIDFDFFSEKALNRDDLRRQFRFLEQAEILQDRPDTLTVLTPMHDAKVKISFFGEIGIGRAGVPERTQDGVVEVASLLDLLATKLKVMQQRIEKKDYQDIAAILRAGVRLEAGLGAATAMYPSNFAASEAVRALTYFQGGDLGTLAEGDKEMLTRAVAQIRRIEDLGLVSRTLSANLEQ